MTSIKGQNFRHNELGSALVHYLPEVPSFYRGHKVLTLGLYFYSSLGSRIKQQICVNHFTEPLEIGYF